MFFVGGHWMGSWPFFIFQFGVFCVWPFWLKAILAQGHFGPRPFWPVAILAQSHFSSKPVWLKAILAQGHFGAKPFWRKAIVAVFCGDVFFFVGGHWMGRWVFDLFNLVFLFFCFFGRAAVCIEHFRKRGGVDSLKNPRGEVDSVKNPRREVDSQQKS